MSGEIFARAALAQIPKILTLQDRDAHSPTYGCFDRNYWHYRMIDFPSGMAAEFSWPLALAYILPIEANPFFQKQSIKDWAEAGIAFAAGSAHRDGSCDDYFPFEKAAGAAAFSLLAGVETYRLLELQNRELLAFFAKRADWLADHRESGRLTNHQALIVLALEKLARLTGEKRWEEATARRLQQVLLWQDPEGWFPEYEGCDPGYHTLTIGLLAQLEALRPDPALRPALENAINFAAHFVHPDGSFGGEYGSRNTTNFFPHGFEIAGNWMPAARAINDRFLFGLTNGLGSSCADDHIIGHHTWSYLLAFQHWNPDRPAPTPPPNGRTHFPGARLLIERRGPSVLYLALNKGGVFKFFSSGQDPVSDTHWSLVVENGAKRTAVAHLIDDYEVELKADTIVIRGQLGWAKGKRLNTRDLVCLRILMLTIGRFFPDLIRRLMQRVLIVGKKPAPFHFKRTLTWMGERLQVADELTADSWSSVGAVGIGPAQTSIYVVMSRTWQKAQLQPWLDLTQTMRTLKEGEALKLERTL